MPVSCSIKTDDCIVAPALQRFDNSKEGLTSYHDIGIYEYQYVALCVAGADIPSIIGAFPVFDFQNGRVILLRDCNRAVARMIVNHDYFIVLIVRSLDGLQTCVQSCRTILHGDND